MKRIAIIAAICVLLSSCSALKRSTKNLTKAETKTEQSDNEAKLSDLRQLDRSVTTITEKAKGVAYTAPKRAETANKLDRLLSGDMIEYREGLITLNQYYDSLSKEIKSIVSVSSDSAEYDVEKETVINSDVQTQLHEKSERSVVNSSESSDYQKSSDRTYSTTTRILMWAAGIGLLIIIGWILKRVL